jgi:hypothetical protein
MSSKFCAMAGLALGALLLVWWGATAPLWLRMIECVGVMGAALIFGFTAYSPSAPEWTRDDAVRGVALVYGGVGVVFIDLIGLAIGLQIGQPNHRQGRQRHGPQSPIRRDRRHQAIR